MLKGIRKRFLIFFILAISLLCLLGYFLLKETRGTIANKFSSDYIKQHISLQKERISKFIGSELILVKSLASSENIIDWLKYEYNASLKISAVKELKRYRGFFKSGSVYIISRDSGHYYLINKQTTGTSVGYTKSISPGSLEYEKYFDLFEGNKNYDIRVNNESGDEKADLWISAAVLYNGKPEGVVGTKIQAADYLTEIIDTSKKGGSTFILNREGSIVAGAVDNKTNFPMTKNIFSSLSSNSQLALKKIMAETSANPDSVLTKSVRIGAESKTIALSFLPETGWVLLSLIDLNGIFTLNDLIIPISFIVIGTILIFLLFALYIDRSIIKPVRDLTKGALRIGEGDYDTKFVIDENDEIGTLKRIFNRMSTEIKLKSYIKDLEDRMRQKSRDLIISKEKISFLLNSAGEGFLRFNPDMRIDSEFSKECFDIFGEDISDKDIHKLLFPEDKENRQFFQRVVNSIFNQEKKFLKEIMIDLLPAETEINGKHYALRFRLGKNNTIVLIMRDITEQKNLSREVEDERRKLNLVVEYVKDEYGVRELIHDFLNFCKNIDSYSVEVVYRKLHTFKGNFLQKGFINIPDFIHAEETYVQNYFRKQQNKLNINTSRLCNALKKDTDILRENLGANVLDNAMIKVDMEKLKLIQQKAKRVDTDLYRELSELLKVPLSGYLEGFRKVVDMVAKKEEKMVDYNIACDPELKIYPEEFRNFINVFYHIVVNAVVHGIEKPEIRVSKGKSETGKIDCKAAKIERFLVIEVADDGQGVDLNYLGKKIGRRLRANQYDILFENGITSSEMVDSYTGRGAGLGAVKTEVEKLKGSVSIDSKKDVGTKVFIKVPMKE
ncbi:MAG TPA: hypothetical protein DHM44_09430 [Flexistipes sinusarabici]|uniref:histidine kinase n=1 Tax=Flexistipes sinusarabici TaxID=2352 RepID=A0A3D5QDS9_FLESI|nr:hypothetical protein [Flexistipes sinusarabici]